jgi:hypothetical protein
MNNRKKGLFFLYPERELNPHSHYWPQDFKSCVSTNSTIRATMNFDKKRATIKSALNFGAENETRTRDPDLGKVVLYQLSYFRNNSFSKNYTHFVVWHLNGGAKLNYFFICAKYCLIFICHLIKKLNSPIIQS